MINQLKNRRLMLISNSFSSGQGYLEHCAEAIKGFLGPITELVFIPYALQDWDEYTGTARAGFQKMGITVTGVHEGGKMNPRKMVYEAPAIFIGGGNTFRLQRRMIDETLIDAIGHRVNHGMPYLGVSAGANVAAPTIKTTNDMPIVFPRTFDALRLVPFQINAHFVATV